MDMIVPAFYSLIFDMSVSALYPFVLRPFSVRIRISHVCFQLFCTISHLKIVNAVCVHIDYDHIVHMRCTVHMTWKVWKFLSAPKLRLAEVLQKCCTGEIMLACFEPEMSPSSDLDIIQTSETRV